MGLNHLAELLFGQREFGLQIVQFGFNIFGNARTQNGRIGSYHFVHLVVACDERIGDQPLRFLVDIVLPYYTSEYKYTYCTNIYISYTI